MQDQAPPAASDADQLVALLTWYQAAGVDCVVGEEPLDWLSGPPHAPGAGFAWPRQDSARQQGPREARTDAAGARPSGLDRADPAALPNGAGGQTGVARTPATSHSSPPPPRARPGELHGETTRAPPTRFATGAPDAAAARRLAQAAGDLTTLEASLKMFDGCALKATAKSTCVYRGAQRARIMIIGEAPGREEDLEGRPFVGRAGQLLDRMLAAIELDDTDVHITNVVYWRPPGNRTPTPQETQICRPFLERQIELVAPEAVLLLGGAAAKAVLEVEEGIMRIRGKWRDATIGTTKVRALATLHPAYLLRTPAAKRLAWRDLLVLKSVLMKK